MITNPFHPFRKSSTGVRARRGHAGPYLLALLAVVVNACAARPAAPAATGVPPTSVWAPKASGQAVTLAAQSTREEDFFYAFGQKTPVTVALDQVGVLAADDVPVAQVGSFLAQRGLQVADAHEGGLVIASLKEPRPRADLVKLARQLRDQGKGLLAQAGIVVTPGQTGTPMLVSDQFIVQFKPNTPGDVIDAFNAENAVQVVMADPFVPDHYLLAVTEGSGLDALQMANRYQESSVLVDYAHPDFVKVVVYRETLPDDPFFASQWHHRNAGAAGATADADVDSTQAWDISQGDSTVVIAVIDSGFDMAHPDLMPNLWQNPGEAANGADDGDPNPFVDDLNGWDFTGCDVFMPPANCGDNNPSPGAPGTEHPDPFVDEVIRAHGTSTAGLAAARGNNTLGVSGTCPTCRLMLLRLPNSDFAQGLAFDYARTMGAQIVSNSWGFPIEAPMTDNLVRAINRAAAEGRGGLGSVVFFAMNNHDGTPARRAVNDCGETGRLPDISSLDSVIAISRSSDRDRFDFSGFGNCMDLLAPTGSLMSRTGGPGITTTDVTGGRGFNNFAVTPACAEPAAPPADARNYTFCFNGTSASTPVTAGAAGLILSANPGLTRLQVQQLLQDTADKVEDSSGAYASSSGFSSPATGQATHGWGRVNAFEAVRVAAPTAAGGREGVDIFLRDNRLDWGNTEQPSNVLLEPVRGGIAHWESMDIKVDAGPDFRPAPTAATFDGFADETPSAIPGETNRVYVRVRNRGPVTAGSVTVKLHWTQFGTALPSLPTDFWTAFPADSTDTSQWHPLTCAGVMPPTTQCTLSDLAYSGASTAGTAGDAAQIVQFDFPAPAFDPALPNHFCLLAMVESTQDPIAGSSRASRVADIITPTDNNVTHRNYHDLVTTRDRSFTERFFVRNPTEKAMQTVLRLDAPKQWTVSMDRFNFDQPFTLKAGEEVLVTAHITLPEIGLQGQVRITQEQLQPRLMIGGLTYNFRPELQGAPDLVPHLSGPEQVGAGEDPGPALTLKVKNQGTATAPGTLRADGSVNPNGYMVDLVLSTDTVVPPGYAVYSSTFHEDVLLRGGRASNTTDLAPGDTLALPIGAGIPADVTPGKYYLCAHVDPGGMVAESDEGNNVTCYRISIHSN